MGERALVEISETCIPARSLLLRLLPPGVIVSKLRMQRIEQRIDVGQPLGFADLIAGDGDVALCLAVEVTPHTVGAWYIITGAMQRSPPLESPMMRTPSLLGVTST